MNIRELAEDFLPEISQKKKTIIISKEYLLKALERFGEIVLTNVESKFFEIEKIQKFLEERKKDDTVINPEIQEILNILSDVRNITINDQRTYEERLCQRVLDIVVSETKIDIKRIKSKSRQREIVRAREVYLSIMYLYSNIKTQTIASLVDRDHASIYNALRNSLNEYVNRIQFEQILRVTGFVKVCRIWTESKSKR